MSEKRSQRKHVPVRMCVVCRERGDKRTLTRIVRTDAGVRVDPGGKMSGRGAYVCDQNTCWERAVNSGVLNNALRTTLTEEDRQHLLQAKPTMVKP